MLKEIPLFQLVSFSQVGYHLSQDKIIKKLEEELEAVKKRLDKNEKDLTLIGRSKGYSGCGRCGGTWNWKEGETIYYSEGRGMFPLCKECFEELDEEEILSYCKKLMKCWIGMGSSDISKNWDKMVDNLKTDIHKLKSCVG
ncbi:unnamed protein product [marine sediment metagenome]|uniref:Uncharacterized protein n=1 Tax=marine sediment metagenome TaxID=412755 RepID=X1GUZ2_9ZZZZ